MGCTGSAPLQAHTFDNFVGERMPPADGTTQRKALVIANPYSGSKEGAKALQLINEKFSKAGITSILKETTHGGHAEEIVNTTDLSDVDMLVSIGGDGTCHEIVNGLLLR
jgi:sphingosine kinase